MNNREPAIIKEMFNVISPRYDFLNHLLSLGVDKSWRRAAASALYDSKNNSIYLDICTGTGDLAFAVHRANKGRVVGTDFAVDMLRIASQKCIRRDTNGAISFSAADSLQLPFKDNVFDGVTVAFGIRNTASLLVCLDEMARVTKHNGRIIVLDFGIPQVNMINKIYLSYFNYVVPLVGRFLSRSNISAYSYLPVSVSKFPPPDEFCNLMSRVGLINVKACSLTFGIAILYSGVKA